MRTDKQSLIQQVSSPWDFISVAVAMLLQADPSNTATAWLSPHTFSFHEVESKMIPHITSQSSQASDTENSIATMH